LLLPEDVFGKEVKNDQQELQRIVPLKGPQLDWDPDIVKALDDVSEHEDDQQLEDNFIQLANTAVDDTGIDTSVDSSWWISRGDYRLTHDEYGSLLSTDGDNNSVDGRKSARFTEYSLSSAVVPRNDGLSMLDERFEEFMVEYDDDLIGPLDEGHDERECNEYEDDIIRSAVDEFIIKHHLKSTKLKHIDKSTCKMIDEYEGDEGEEGREGVIVQVERNDHEWDCESILSTYSNLYNHPTLIREDKKPTKVSNYSCFY
jgi:protein LTV1